MYCRRRHFRRQWEVRRRPAAQDGRTLERLARGIRYGGKYALASRGCACVCVMRAWCVVVYGWGAECKVQRIRLVERRERSERNAKRHTVCEVTREPETSETTGESRSESSAVRIRSGARDDIDTGAPGRERGQEKNANCFQECFSLAPRHRPQSLLWRSPGRVYQRWPENCRLLRHEDTRQVPCVRWRRWPHSERWLCGALLRLCCCVATTTNSLLFRHCRSCIQRGRRGLLSAHVRRIARARRTR